MKVKRSKLIIIAGVILAIPLTYSLSTGELYIHANDDLEKYLSTKEHYENILNYTNYNMGNLNITFVDRYKPINKLPEVYEFTDSDEDKLRKIINYLNRYPYNDIQNDPSLLEEYGGNCQAKSLLAKNYFDKENWSNELVYTEDHMYNRVKINDNWYTLDLTENILKREK